MKRLCDENMDEPNESGWDNIVQRVYRKYNDQYSEKVESYKKEGYSEGIPKGHRKLILEV